jgi:hypothetical protein
MYIGNQHYVTIDKRTGKPAEGLHLLLSPEFDYHARVAMVAYARSLARENIKNAKIMQSLMKAMGIEFELFPKTVTEASIKPQ